MKLVQINLTLKSGSTGQLAYQIHRYAAAQGMESSIAFGYGDKSDPAGFSMYSKMGTHLHSFLSRKLCMQGLCSVRQTKRLIRYLKKEKPDIVHLHNIHGHYLNYPLLFRFLRSYGKPVVWTIHDCWAFTGKCSHYFSVGCDKWKNGCYDCPNLAAYPDSTFDGSRWNYRLKKKWFSSLDNLNVISNSDWTKAQVDQSFLKGKSLARIYNGVDTMVFRPSGEREAVCKKYGIDPQKFIILGVSGVWKKDKGLHVFLDLAKMLSSNYQLVMVGVTNDQKRILPESIVGITRTENVQVLAELYSAADVLLNPSREETFGMVAAEAMACGTPVVVSDTTACPEIVTDRTGMVVDTTQIDHIIAAIVQIKQTGKHYFSESCIKNIQDNFSQINMCRQYYQLYKKLMGGASEEHNEQV